MIQTLKSANRLISANCWVGFGWAFDHRTAFDAMARLDHDRPVMLAGSMMLFCDFEVISSCYSIREAGFHVAAGAPAFYPV